MTSFRSVVTIISITLTSTSFPKQFLHRLFHPVYLYHRDILPAGHIDLFIGAGNHDAGKSQPAGLTDAVFNAVHRPDLTRKDPLPR